MRLTYGCPHGVAPHQDNGDPEPISGPRVMDDLNADGKSQVGGAEVVDTVASAGLQLQRQGFPSTLKREFGAEMESGD